MNHLLDAAPALAILGAVGIAALLDWRRERMGAARCLICGQVFDDPADFPNHRCRVPRPAA